jgi:3-phosphoshikimate 1-carboxyvinyltransferase
VPGDYSSAANILAPCSFIQSDVELRNLFKDDIQGDKKVVDILSEMGAELEYGKESIFVKGSDNLKPVQVDASNTPDIVLALVSAACLAKGTSLFKNIGHMRYKESDRIKACNEFRKLGVLVETGKDYVKVAGAGKLRAAKLRGYEDHRVVMALAGTCLRAEGESVIGSADMLNVSFPNYLESMQSLGARMRLG